MTSLATIKLTRGVPPTESFPSEKLAQCATAALMEDAAHVLQYGKAGGYPPLRDFLAREAGVEEARVIIGQGSLQLQDFCARMLLHPGAVVYVEEPTYDRTLTVLRRAGARIVGFPLQADGPDVDAVAARLKSGERPIFFYLIPDFQNPSGSVLSEEKRRRLAELAETYGFWLIEDVPYRKLRYRGQGAPTFMDLAPERTLQMSSYSKQISPGLRVGYVIAPFQVAKPLTQFIEDTYINPSYFNQAVVYQFIKNGWLEPNLAALRDLYAPRLDTMLAALDEHLTGLADWHRPEGGFFIGVTLHKPVKAADLISAGATAGLQLTDGRGFFNEGGGDTFVRLPFCALTPDEIRTGIARLGEVVRTL